MDKLTLERRLDLIELDIVVRRASTIPTLRDCRATLSPAALRFARRPRCPLHKPQTR